MSQRRSQPALHIGHSTIETVEQGGTTGVGVGVNLIGAAIELVQPLADAALLQPACFRIVSS